MAAPRIYTYADAIEHLIMFLQARGVEYQRLALIRGAILAAYDDIPQLCNWPTLSRPGRINLTAPYSTGTVVYDHTGGTYERMLTLTTGTWPTWAADGVVRVDSKNCHVEARKSSSVITLDASMNPGADVASTTYELFKQWYVLPEDFLSMTGPIRESSGLVLSPISLTEMLKLHRNSYNSGDPNNYAIAEAPDLLGSMAIYLHPVSASATSLDFVSQRRPRALRHTGYAAADYAGTFDVTSGSATIAGTSSLLADTMEGAVLRIGASTTDRPTGLEGDYPYAEQRSITSVSSTTAATLDNDVVTTRTGIKCTVSSPIDLSVSVRNLFLRQCESHLAARLGLPDRDKLAADAFGARILAMGSRMTEIVESPGGVGLNSRFPTGSDTSSWD